MAYKAHKKTPDSSRGEICKGEVRLSCGGPSVAKGLGCNHYSDFAPLRSPAAPALARAEELEAEGWTHDGGSFASLLLGLSVLCPMCSRSARMHNIPPLGN